MIEERASGNPDSTLRITSVPWEVWKEESIENVGKFEEGEVSGGHFRLNFHDPTQIQRILTPKRLELLRSVMTESPGSIRGLANRLGRNVSDVHEDVQLLAEYDIVQFESEGRAKRPVVPYGEIVIEVRLSPPESDDEESTAAP